MVIILNTWSTRSMRKRPVMPEFLPYVKELMYKRKLSIPGLAKMMGTTADTGYRLLRREDWKLSEMMVVSDILHTNLFEFFAKPVPESTPAVTTEQITDEMKTLRQRNELLEQENRLLREMVDMMKQKAKP